MKNPLKIKPYSAVVAFRMPDYYLWDSSVVYAQGEYHLFCSRWPKQLGFGWNWLFNSEIIHATAKQPEGPYTFQNVVLPRRGRAFFDGMNTHNACIRLHENTCYLYYMGCTYGGDGLTPEHEASETYGVETWNRKRIGLATAADIGGEFTRRDTPLLEPRDCSHWDCTITTNPSVAILPDGQTYLIYKSRTCVGAPLQLGAAYAEHPAGPFRRLSETPILRFDDPDIHIEDPFFWYDQARRKFCLLAKDDSKNGAYGITGEWGAGFYAESDDCIHFEPAEQPKVYSREMTWRDGSKSTRCNLERPSLLFSQDAKPTHLFCASGCGDRPYGFTGVTDIVCMELE